MNEIPIPQQLQQDEFRFCLLRGKIPFEKEWQKKGYKWNNPKLQDHIKKGNNYGCIGGYGNLRVIDIDDKKLIEKFDIDTFTVETGSGGRHLYFISDYNLNHVFTGSKGEVRANNYQVVGASCLHPNGKRYKIIKDLPITELSKKGFEKLIEPYLRENVQQGSIPQGIEEKDTSRSGREFGEVIKLIRQGLNKEDVFKQMEVYVKWTTAAQQYRELTYEKAKEKVKEHPKKVGTPELTPEIEEILFDPKLLQILIKELDKEIKGEEDTKHYFLIAIGNIWVKNSKKRLHTLVISKSSAGKSYVCGRIVKLFPDELVVYKSRISEVALTYLHANEPGWNWNGKILYLEDIEESVLNSSVHKVFLSEGAKESSIVTKAGVVTNFKVKGIPLEITTTAEAEPKIEMVNRYNQISLDETTEQTQNINVFTAREYQTGEKRDYNEDIKNALKCLKVIEVRIPFADKIAKIFPSESIKVRRDFPRFLELIMGSAALHQYQRKKDENGFVLADKQDYEYSQIALAKMQMSSSMITLTTTQMEMLGVCHKLSDNSLSGEDEKEKLLGFTAQDSITAYPNVHERYWYDALRLFTTKDYDLLSVQLIKMKDVKKKVRIYRTKKEFTAFNLPKWEVL